MIVTQYLILAVTRRRASGRVGRAAALSFAEARIAAAAVHASRSAVKDSQKPPPWQLPVAGSAGLRET
jgi:hypothetical protein